MDTAGKRRFIVAGLILGSLLIGCASDSVSPESTGARLKGAALEKEYIIGPGDSIRVFVWRNSEVSVTVPVRPDGKISTPLVEEMQAAGKTPARLARDIEAELATYIKNPIVTVIVSEFVGVFSRQIRVVGQAVEPQALPYRERMTLLDVMIAVGGLGEFAAGNRAKIIRSSNGSQTEIPVRLGDLLNKGEIGVNVEMAPGDVLIIPEAIF